MPNRILITGAAGFIGFHLSKFLTDCDNLVIGLDNINNYYSPELKLDRLEILLKNPNFNFEKLDLNEIESLSKLFTTFKPDYVINLAAQAGVRYSINNPRAYIDSNIIGFFNILECCRHFKVKHLIYASSSSVYGNNKSVPYSINHMVDHPVSLYAATKKSNELMAFTYSHLFSIPTTGLRFFTVYGPWGRPDMAYFSFTKNIVNNQSIKVYNYGNLYRDFTYIDDIISAVEKIIWRPPSKNNINKTDIVVPYKIYNIGNSNPIQLNDFISLLEKKIGKTAIKEYVEMQAGDVIKTYADVSELENEIGFRPSTSLEIGLDKFIRWFREYYNE